MLPKSRSPEQTVMKNKPLIAFLFGLVIGAPALAQQSIDSMIDREIAQLVGTLQDAARRA